MKTKLLYIVAICFFLKTGNTIACSCMTPIPDFSSVYKTADLVAVISVANYLEFYEPFPGCRDYPLSMEANIIYTYAGKENRKTIIIHGGNGANCTNTIEKSLFKNKYLIVALYKDNNEYRFGGCGQYKVNITFWFYSLYLLLVTIIIFIIFRYTKKKKGTTITNS